MVDSSLVQAVSLLVEQRPLPQSPVALSVPDEDDPIVDDDELGYAEGQSFIIEYHDSRGRPSMRRITVLELRTGHGGIPCLMARCHERKALRQFRVDRIQSCIDYDGEVFDNVAAFLSDTFGMAQVASSLRLTPGSRHRWADIVDLVRSEAVLFSALSRCDGLQHPAETEAAVQSLALTAERAGMFLTEDEVAKIYDFVKRLRPSSAAIDRALSVLEARAAADVRRFLINATTIIDADGLRHPQELALVDEIAAYLVGTRVN